MNTPFVLFHDLLNVLYIYCHILNSEKNHKSTKILFIVVRKEPPAFTLDIIYISRISWYTRSRVSLGVDMSCVYV